MLRGGRRSTSGLSEGMRTTHTTQHAARSTQAYATLTTQQCATQAHATQAHAARSTQHAEHAEHMRCMITYVTITRSHKTRSILVATNTIVSHVPTQHAARRAHHTARITTLITHHSLMLSIGTNNRNGFNRFHLIFHQITT